jgi:hypothetical protein
MHDMPIELVPLCEVDVTLAEPILVGEGPAGLRLVGEVIAARATGRLTGSLKGNAAADWLVVHGAVASLDVRVTMETDDGAVVFAQYNGRMDMSEGLGAKPVYVAPRFETGDPRYAWLNLVQAVGKGRLDGTKLHYEWYEVR